MLLQRLQTVVRMENISLMLEELDQSQIVKFYLRSVVNDKGIWEEHGSQQLEELIAAKFDESAIKLVAALNITWVTV